ncbi:unnamed protein product [Gordionus sp. m RMFG-2023]
MIAILKNFLNNYSQYEKSNFKLVENEFIKVKAFQIDNIQEFDSKIKPDIINKCSEASSSKDSDNLKNSLDIKYTCEIANLPENLKKNRYKDVNPFDHNRVILKPFTDSPNKSDLIPNPINNDYINASYIKGVISEREYVASQGPLESTIIDFWQLIWQEDIKIILMICNLVEDGKTKCERYWPSEGEKLNLIDEGNARNLSIKLMNFAANTEYGFIKRILRVYVGVDFRDIVHLQILDWPDASKPTDIKGIIHILKEINEVSPYNEIDLVKNSSKTYILIHCSAGVGRTGVFIAIHMITNCLSLDKLSTDFSIYNRVIELRKQRPLMVQTYEQYLFIYEACALLFAAKVANLTGDLDEFEKDSLKKVTKIEELAKISTKRLEEEDRNVLIQLERHLLYLQNLYSRFVDLEVSILFRTCQLEAGIIEEPKLWSIHNSLKSVKIDDATNLIDNLKDTLQKLMPYWLKGESIEKRGVLYRFNNLKEEDLNDWIPAHRMTPELNNNFAGIYIANTRNAPISINKINQDIDYLLQLFRNKRE